MDTLIFLRDTITANVVKVVDSCQPCFQEAETNCKDIAIVAIICVTIFFIAIAAITAYYCLKKEEYDATKSPYYNSSNNITIERQKAEFKNRLLSFLEKNNKDLGKTPKTRERIESDVSQYYIKVLAALIDGSNIPDYTKEQITNDGK